MRARTLALAVLLVALLVPGFAAAAGATGVQATISDVSVTPTNPIPGSQVVVEPTIENFQSSTTGYRIEHVVVESKTASTEYARAEDLGTITVGGQKTVPLTFSLEEPGTYDMRVAVFGQAVDSNDVIRLNYPVTVQVVDQHPQLDIDADNAITGVQKTGTVTVSNGMSADISNVELTIDGESAQITNEREVIATLQSGNSATVEFKYRPEESGTHDLTATLSYSTAGGTTDSVSETVTYAAADSHPQLAIDTNSSVAGVESTGTVTIANGLGTAITNVEVTVQGEGVTIQDDREVLTRLQDGEAATTTFEFRPESPGDHTVTATLTYTTQGGATRTVSQPVTITSDPLNDQVSLEVSTVEGGESQGVTVSVINQGNAPISNVTVRGFSDNATVRRGLIQEIQPGESREIRLNASLASKQADIDVRAIYDAGLTRETVEAETTLTKTPGVIGLTGVNVLPQGDTLQISGSASNLGTTKADSVIVSVVDTENVDPAYPAREFFVGTVPASDFVSFDVYASTTGNVSTIPLQVTYLVDGQRHSRTIEVATGNAGSFGGFSPNEQRQPSGGSGGGGGILLPAVVGGVVVIIVLAIIVRAWRNSRGGD